LQTLAKDVSGSIEIPHKTSVSQALNLISTCYFRNLGVEHVVGWITQPKVLSFSL